MIMGSVFLVVTGGEALYADMGHFGRKPISRAWTFMVFPALILNYLGQGALVLDTPAARENPFFYMAPGWALYPLVALATVATIIASQALISGAFSLTMQGIQMGYIPRMEIRHTSRDERGQIYIPKINIMLAVGCIALVIGFQSSTALASAYGIAVTLTMLATTASSSLPPSVSGIGARSGPARPAWFSVPWRSLLCGQLPEDPSRRLVSARCRRGHLSPHADVERWPLHAPEQPFSRHAAR